MLLSDLAQSIHYVVAALTIKWKNIEAGQTTTVALWILACILSRQEATSERAPDGNTHASILRKWHDLVFQIAADERKHLFTLAGQPLPAQEAQPDFYVRPVLQSLLDALNPCPAHIRNSRWDVLAWNAAESLVTDWEERPVAQRNALLNHFCNPRMRQIMPKWEEDGRMMIALFRLEYACYAHIIAFQELVGRLQKDSDEFRQWWSEHEVRSQRLEPMEFEHLERGPLILDRLTVIVDTGGEVKKPI